MTREELAMRGNTYEAEEVWLHSHFEALTAVNFELSAEAQMRVQGISLPEVLHVLRTGHVEWADRTHELCEFMISGRNCDDEIITIVGGFEAGVQVALVLNVNKQRQ